MKVLCEREKLLSAFQTAATVAPSRSPKAILCTVKLVASPQRATLMATDTEVGIRLEITDIDVTSAGQVVLPIDRFGPLLRESTDDKLRLETDGNKIVIRGVRSEFNLSAQNPDEFPEVPEFAEEKYHQLSARLMKELVRRTLFATDTESSRYALGGVLLEFHEARILAVGTDGRRLAKMEGPAKEVGGHKSQADSMTIVPSRAMQLIERALGEAEGEVRVAGRGNELLVSSPRASIVTRLVEGRFPKWQDVLVERPGTSRIELSVGPFYSAVRQAAVVASDESRGIDLEFGGGTVVLTSVTAEVGQSHVELPISYQGPAVKITLDHRFISDFLRVLDPQKTVSLAVKDNETAAEFTTDDGYTYVVMPLSRESRR